MERVEDDLPVHELVGKYILELRGKGVCLPFQDYVIIQGWVQEAQGQHEVLFAVLEQKLPGYFEGKEDRPPSLKRVDASVKKEIRAQL